MPEAKTISVAELIEKLKTFPQHLPVVTGGFDDMDYSPVDSIEVIKLVEFKGGIAEFRDADDINLGQTTIRGPFQALYIDH
ncbi:MAG: hypothetical protein RDA78_03040 [Roseibium sp.]|uniref:hypothetical protein n=1 Tax=Roseibium sp. TaxID=1936156 RepID=UPI003D9C506B